MSKPYLINRLQRQHLCCNVVVEWTGAVVDTDTWGYCLDLFPKAHTCTFFSKLTVIVFVIFLSFSAIACRDLAKLE